jgi:CrcB protein
MLTMEFLRKIIMVAAGGAIGSACRFTVYEWMTLRFGFAFPWSTLAVNIIGCFAMGLLYSLGEARQVFNPETRALVLVGVLGGFTTFSAFANDTWHLGKEGRHDLMFANIGLQMILCLAAVWAGHWLAQTCWSR